jgi:hypothetical protein
VKPKRDNRGNGPWGEVKTIRRGGVGRSNSAVFAGRSSAGSEGNPRNGIDKGHQVHYSLHNLRDEGELGMPSSEPQEQKENQGPKRTHDEREREGQKEAHEELVRRVQDARVALMGLRFTISVVATVLCVFRGMSITDSDAMSITRSDAMSITDSDVMPITFGRCRNG